MNRFAVLTSVGALVLASGMASAAISYSTRPLDADLRGVPMSSTEVVYELLAGPYAAFPTGGGVLGADDYVSTISSPTFRLAEMTFIGDIASAGPVTLNFFNADSVLVNSATLSLPVSAPTFWTITFGALPDGSDSTFEIASAGFVQIVAGQGTTGRWWLSSAMPTVGSTSNAFPGVVSGGMPLNHTLELVAVPTPGAAALLALGGLIASRRRRA